MIERTNLDWALAYAAQGWAVFPLEPGSKGPHGNSVDLARLGKRRSTRHRLAPRGFKDATTDERRIREWWKLDPLAGIGWAIGDEYLVLDVDVKNGKQGPETLKALTQRHGGLKSGPCAITPSGGMHIVFRTGAPVRGRTEVLGPGLDVKAQDGYIVLAPTTLRDDAGAEVGSYAWANFDPFADDGPTIPLAPDWIGDEMRAVSGSGSGFPAQPDDDGTEFARQAELGLVDERTLEDLRQALEYIPADDRDVWIRMGQALATLNGTEWAEEARQLWLEWSETSAKFNPEVDPAKWASFRASRTGHAAVFAEAERCGWSNPRAGIAPGKMTAEEVVEALRPLRHEEILAQWCEMAKHLPRESSKVVVDAVSRFTGSGVRPLGQQLAATQQRDQQQKQEETLRAEVGERLEIEYRASDMTQMAREAEAAIVAAAQPGEYISFGGSVCEVTTRAAMGPHLTDHNGDAPPAVPLIQALNDVAMLERIERVAVIVMRNKGKPRAIGVPTQVRDILLGQRASSAPAVSGLVTHAIVLPSGEILAEDGLHQGSQLYLHGATLPGARPYTQQEAAAALQRLRSEFLEGFEFASAADADVAIAGLLTGVQRAILDSAPGLLVVAHMQASGKTTLARRLHVTLTGHDLPVSTFPRNDEAEVQKSLLASLMRAPAVVCFDNLPDGSTFTSPSLALAMTSSTFRQRQLGASKEVEAPTNTLFVLTGNNVSLGRDEESRWMVTHLAPSTGRPSERTFRHPDVVAHARANREAVLGDAVGIVAGYLRQGTRSAAVTRFSGWDRMVRQPLLWAGGFDLCECFRDNSAQSEAGLALAALLTSLLALFGGAEFTASQLADRLLAHGPDRDFAGMGDDEANQQQCSALRDALEGVGVARGAQGSGVTLGRALAQLVGQVVRIGGREQGSDASLKTRLKHGAKVYWVSS